MSTLEEAMRHYNDGQNAMQQRKNRKPGGWDDIINCYMGRLPDNWPYISVFTDPVVRTTILEKTARLLNSKLKGKLTPRENSDIIKARIQNAILDFQWDYANEGGSMLEKVAQTDQLCRVFGAGFVLVYWNNKTNSNEIKVIDPRDIFLDYGATHVRNAKWIQIREYVTEEAMIARGLPVEQVQGLFDANVDDRRETNYQSQVKINRGLNQNLGNQGIPTLEIVTEYTADRMQVFTPKHLDGFIIDQPNPYKHGKAPIAMLRYYPLPDDIYGESEVEPVIGLQKAINACLCGFFDQMNLSMQPPLKIVSGKVRMESIEYGPGARWIVNSPEAVTEAQLGQGTVNEFNTTYSALKAAFNTAMGSQSLGVSNIGPYQGDKTATEINQLSTQQNTRDQYNQLYLAEFLKEIVMMWVSNNKQYLFDDPTKTHIIMKIVGKDKIREFEALGLGNAALDQSMSNELGAMTMQNPDMMNQGNLEDIVNQSATPEFPVVTNPYDFPENFDVHRKLETSPNGSEASLYVTPDDMEGVYDYEPDVKSMAAGSSIMMQNARNKVYEMVLNNPTANQMLAQQGYVLNVKELFEGMFEDAGYRDAESLFTSLQEQAQATAANAAQNPMMMAQMGGMMMPQGMQNGGQPQPPDQNLT